MNVLIREAAPDEVFSILLEAEPSPRALRWSLENMSDATYALEADGVIVAAATMRWDEEPVELVELAVAPEKQGHGYGRKLVEWLFAEGERRGKRNIIVGTSSTSAGNILFYQKCGFRVDTVRRDYFWYYQPPLIENGLEVRDMIVFRRDLSRTRR